MLAEKEMSKVHVWANQENKLKNPSNLKHGSDGRYQQELDHMERNIHK